MSNNYETHKVKIIDKYTKVRFGSADQDYINLDELYQYARSIQNEYIFEGKLNNDFFYITKYIKKAEMVIKPEFIIDSNYDKICIDANSSSELEKLNYIVCKVRQELERKFCFTTKPEMIIDYDEMIDNYSSYFVNEYAKELNLKVKNVIIYPAFNKGFLDEKLHTINIITIGDKDYIVDLIYKCFFIKRESSLERIGICGLFNTLPGRFMMMNDSRLKTASKLLKDGYVEMTDENIKNYFDGFALSYRNATYYEDTEDFSFSTIYSPNDYMRFIDGEDSQLIHEGTDRLGYQKKILRNPNISFTR